MSQLKYLNALNLISGVGPQKMKIILNHFGTAEKAWKADLRELVATKIPEKLAEKIVFGIRNINPDTEWEKLEKENIKILTPDSLDYPDLLKQINNPPFVLYARGKTDFINLAPLIAVVGSRKYTSYGAQVAENFARDLSAAGLAVVSGMALGIDTFAHRGTLASGGKTIAVMGNGLDDGSIYPRNNFNLSREIMREGALISDYPCGTEAGPQNFPARNRIVAGMTLGTLVVEAGEQSGALITANLALEYNREVFAVPGSILSPQSIGANNLIKNGAKLAMSVKDILEELNLLEEKLEKKVSAKVPSSPEEEIILNILSSDPLHIDNIGKLAKLQTAAVASALSMMEIKGWVKNIGGQNYIII